MSESGEIKRMGATPVKNSGRGINKGDCTFGPFLLDIKEYSKSYTVSLSSWAKISTDAIKRGDGSQPGLFLVLSDGKITQRVVVVGEKMWREMLEAWEEKHGRDDS